jgi:SsrA-binding protein
MIATESPMPAERDAIRPICQNRRARHEYEVLDRLEAGIVLVGSEVKSLRAGAANLVDAYVRIEEGQASLVSAHIAPYSHANRENHEPTRTRRLLLSKHEIRRLAQKIREKGLTVIPLAMYFCGPWVKVELAVGRGKKLHDKREAIKQADDARDMDRARRRRE